MPKVFMPYYVLIAKLMKAFVSYCMKKCFKHFEGEMVTLFQTQHTWNKGGGRQAQTSGAKSVHL